jgi:hypothetical protein
MADLRKYLQTQKFSLKSSISLSDTTIELTAFKLPDGTAIASGDLGSVNYATIAPGTANEEQISFTGFTGTSLTGVTRGLKFNDDYTQDTDLRKAHAAGTKVVISNTAGFYGDFVNKYNDETVSGTLTVPAPTAGGHAATKDYVDAASSGSQLAYDRIVVAGNAGETVASGELVYFDDTDNEWKKTDANTATTVNEVLLGIAQGAGTNGNPITGGVLLRGLDSTQTGMTIGVKLYASDTAGAIAESAGTTEKIIGFSKSATELYFDPYFGAFLTASEKDALAGTSGTPSSSNKFVTADDVSNAGASGKIVRATGTALPGLIGGVSAKIATSASATEIADNTTTETTIFQESIAAGILGTTNAVRFKLYISNISTKGNSETMTFRMKYGSTTICTFASAAAGGAQTDFQGFIEGVLIANSSTSAQRGTMFLNLSQSSTDFDEDYSTATQCFIHDLITGTAAEDSTGALNLTLTVQHSEADGVIDVVPAGYTVESIT